MHACRHDGHTVMLLGVAKYLSQRRDSFSDTIHVTFQPDEEKLESALVVMNDFQLMLVTDIDDDKFGIRPGPMMAAPARWIVTFQGSSGHGGAYPHLATDLTILQAQIIVALQTIVSRNIASTDLAIISVGVIESGSLNASNVMPSKIRIGGTTFQDVPSTLERIFFYQKMRLLTLYKTM